MGDDFLCGAIPQALLSATLTILQSADLQMSKGSTQRQSLCLYIPISIVGKLISIPISISFSREPHFNMGGFCVQFQHV